ncbi:MAG: hypothetical protein ACLVBP_00225 [Ruminococcus sp.]
MACVLTWKDVPKKRFALCRTDLSGVQSCTISMILDQHLRFVGDAVAIVAGETEAAVDLAMKRIKVKYRVETPVLDMHTAKDNPVLVHPEEDWESKFPVGADNKRNLCA